MNKLFTFSEVLTLLKAGVQVGKVTWGDDDFLSFVKGKESHFVASGDSRYIKITSTEPYIIKHVGAKAAPGWVPSQVDMFATDYFITEVEKWSC